MKYNFIEEYSIDKDLCKRLIEFFKSVPMGTNTPYYRKLQGQVGSNQVIKSIKDSTDLTFSNKLILRIGDINMKAVHGIFILPAKEKPNETKK